MLRPSQGLRKVGRLLLPRQRSEQKPEQTSAAPRRRRKKPKSEIKARRVDGPADVTVFGDSHSVLFLPFQHYYGRLGIVEPPRYTIAGKAMYAASIAGLRPKRSTLKTKERIQAALPQVERLVLALGQVDLELGYYHRLAVKGEQHTPESYVDWLLGIYADFVDGLDISGPNLALKGVNLTSLAPHDFAVQYVRKIVRQGDQLSGPEADAKLAPFMLSEAEQNAMHLSFNAGLKDLAERSGFRYFDIVAETAEPDSLPAAPRLAEVYRTAKPDHHLADTVPVRRIHYAAVGSVFGLDGDRVSPYFEPAKRV